MEVIVEKMLKDFEGGKLSRRQLAMGLTAMATGLASGTARAATPDGLKAISLNHVTLHVPDLHKTSNFYQKFFGMKLAQQSATVHILSVGESFFGIEQKAGPADLDHYDFGLANWNAAAARQRQGSRPEAGAGLGTWRRVVQIPRPRWFPGADQRPQIHRPCRPG